MGRQSVASSANQSFQSSNSSKDSSNASTISKSRKVNASYDKKNPVADTNVVGIVSINRDGKILFSNSKAQGIFECAEFTGRSIHDFVPESFREKHASMIINFFDRKFVGERLDPDTIIRAQLESGKQVALHLALETKVDFVTGKPSLVVAFITEAATLIEQSKVEKMLSRATLVIMEQFVAQTVLSVSSFIEILTTVPLRYGDATSDQEKYAACEKFAFGPKEGAIMGEEEKMMFFILSSALTVLIAILPLFINRSQAEASTNCFTSNFRKVANGLNDMQDYLSNIKIFRAVDLVTIIAIVTMSNYYLFYRYNVLPSEFDVTSYKQCERNVEMKARYSLIMSVLGILPFCYWSLKELNRRIIKAFGSIKIHAVSAMSDKKIDPPVVEYSKMKRFKSDRLKNLEEYGPKCPIYQASQRSRPNSKEKSIDGSVNNSIDDMTVVSSFDMGRPSTDFARRFETGPPPGSSRSVDLSARIVSNMSNDSTSMSISMDNKPLRV